jgi:hypothetical protein
MKIEQYAYFGIYSDEMPPDEITARVGVEPDHVAVRGSRIQDPPRPVSHMWHVECREPGLTVDEQIARVVARVGPKRAAIRALVESSSDTGAVLRIVRYFDSDQGEEEELTVVGDLHKLTGQHQLLGWHLSSDVLDFVRDVHAEIDADEYG